MDRFYAPAICPHTLAPPILSITSCNLCSGDHDARTGSGQQREHTPRRHRDRQAAAPALAR